MPLGAQGKPQDERPPQGAGDKGGTWRCEVHGLDLPIRAWGFAGLGGTYREDCPECAREAQEQGRALASEAEARERERGRLQARVHSGIPQRYWNATLNPETPADVLAEIEPFVEHPATMRTGFIFLGAPGTGKTYTACAVLGEFLDRGRTATYMTARGALRRIKAAWRSESGETEGDVAAWFASLDLLVIDEMGVDLGSPFEVSHLTDIINARYAEEMPAILIGNLTPEEFAQTYGDRMVDRFREDGRVVVFTGPSRRGQP